MAITPYLLYRDADAAIDWLGKAFGLRKRGEVYKDASGRATHATLTFGDSLLMLGSPGPSFKNPKALGQATQNLYVDVDDVAKHYARAVKAGAKIIEEPKDTFYGARRYGAEDPEGHQWYFAEDLSAEQAKPRKAPRPKKRTSSKRAKVQKHSSRR
jgi:uncharacterized glyoxalase superfamily protein PhnB